MSGYFPLSESLSLVADKVLSSAFDQPGSSSRADVNDDAESI